MTGWPDPAILLPDILCDVALFAPLMPALSADRPVMVAPIADGDRAESVAQALLDRFPPRFVLIGQGLGGVIAMEVLRRAPDRIAGLALIASYTQGETPAKAAERDPRIASARAGRMEAVAEAEFPPGCLAPGVGRADVQRRIAAMARQCPPERYAAQSRLLQRRADYQGTLRRVQSPALVLCGAHDTLAPPRRQQIVAELIYKARFDVIAEAGHMPALEAPDATCAILSDWLSGI